MYSASAPGTNVPSSARFGQIWYAPVRQYAHSRQDRIGSTTTRSPAAKPVTPSPSSATSPQNSCPGEMLAIAGNAPS